MRHLSPDALLDIAEDARLESTAPHLATCASCRAQVEEARRTLALVAAVDVPEPSPLFWEHLSARVREAVSHEATPPRRWGWLSWQWTAAASAAVVVLAVGLVLRNGPISPASLPAAGQSVAAGAEALVSLQDDPSLSLIADLAGDLDWEGAAEAGFVVRAGAVEGAVTNMSADELVELRRLLTEELGAGDQTL